jgi:hypothetical protein
VEKGLDARLARWSLWLSHLLSELVSFASRRLQPLPGSAACDAPLKKSISSYYFSIYICKII